VEELSPADVRARLHRFGLARDRLKMAVAQAIGVSQADLHALEQLEEAGALTPSQFARRLGLTSGAVTALIDRLERAGCVARHRHPTDRRSVVVRLSEASLAAGATEFGRYEADIEAVIAELSVTERATVGRFLEAVADLAARYARQRAETSRPAATPAGVTVRAPRPSPQA